MRVFSGLEVLLADHPALLSGRNIGMIVNQTSVDSYFSSSIDLIADLPGASIGAVFSPEHGLYGVAQDMEGVASDHERRLEAPIYTLYSNSFESLKPTREMLSGLDLLVFDIQDIGARYYTYCYTMAFCMEAAAESDIPFVVLDRPNPLGGITFEGNIGSIDFRSFVGYYPLPVRHAMTVGELARYFNEEYGIGADLAVVHLDNWRRRMWFDETGLPWVAPSPNMPTLDTAVVYPGGCLIEGTNLSEGRGTTRPFEMVGAPFIDAHGLAERMNKLGLEGVSFRPVYFKPMFQKFAGEVCGGVFVHVIDRNHFRPFLTYLSLIVTIKKDYPEHFAWRTEPYEFNSEHLAFDLLCGSDSIRKMIDSDQSLKTIKDYWSVDLATFQLLRENYLLYRNV